MKSIIAVFFIVLFVNCSSNSSKAISQAEYKELMEQSILLTPDSLMTNKELSLKIKVLDFLYTYVSVEDNKQIFPATREQMVEKGIPDMYYDILLYQLNENNLFVEHEEKGNTMLSKALDIENMTKVAKERYWNTERQKLIQRLDSMNLK